MNLQQILSDLHQQRNRLDQAIAALETLGGESKRRPGRPPKKAVSSVPARRSRPMSAAARKRIGEAKRKWWAKQKKGK
jgi:hypothetical protein